jgi:hypothetical protein
MRKYEDPNLLDYRYGGDRLGDFAEKYMRTLAYVFDALNELDATDIDHYLFKLEGNTVDIRDEDGEEWIKFVEISTDGEGNKILLFDGSSPLWGGKAHHLSNLQDGQILVWSEAEHAFINQNKAPDYVLPKATSSTLGGVKVGSNISVNDGVISVTGENVKAALGTGSGTERFLREDGTWQNVATPSELTNAINVHNNNPSAHQEAISRAIANHNVSTNSHPDLRQKINEANSEIKNLWGDDLIERKSNGDLTIANEVTGTPVKLILMDNDNITFGDEEFFTRHLEYNADGDITMKEE